MCDKTVEEDPGLLPPVPHQYKTHHMCDKVLEEDPGLLEYAPDWFVTQQRIGLWGDDDDYYDDKLIEWYEGKAQKAKIKEELLPIAWHPDCVMDWCLSEDEKRWW